MYISTTTTAERAGLYSTPGEILKEEFLDPLHITNYRLAKTIGVSETSIGEIVRGKRRISVPMAARLAKAFSMTPEFWINLQTDYDLLAFDSGNIEGIKPLVTA